MNTITEPCPFCDSIAISLQTRPSESRAFGSCYTCGAEGPLAPRNDPRPWDHAAAEEWNLWARARRNAAGGHS